MKNETATSDSRLAVSPLELIINASLCLRVLSFFIPILVFQHLIFIFETFIEESVSNAIFSRLFNVEAFDRFFVKLF